MIKEKTKELHITSDIDIEVEKFSLMITNVAEKSIGKTRTLEKHQPLPWWNKNCDEAIKQTKHAYNIYKRHKTTENLLRFKNLRARSRYIMKQSRKKSWENFVTSINNKTQSKEVWNMIRRIDGKKSYQKIALLQSNGSNIHTNIEIAETLAETYAQNSDENNFPENFDYMNPQEYTVFNHANNDMNVAITEDEIDNALRNINKNSKEGPDNIPAIFLLHLSQNAKHHLLNIYNKIWLGNVFPKQWTNAIIVPIHKQGKSKTDPNSYRPISLTCTMCKVLEKIINKRLMWFLEKEQLLIPEQNGFRPSRSTLDNLISLESEVHECLANNIYCSCVQTKATAF